MGFKTQLGGFLTGNRSICGTIVTSGPMYLNNMKLVYEKYPDDLRNGNFNITVSLKLDTILTENVTLL